MKISRGCDEMSTSNQEMTMYTTHIGHEFLAGRSNLFGESGAEHHDLFVMRCDAEDFLNVPAHV